MICTDTDNYVNVNYKERNKKSCSFKVAYLFHRTSCSNFFLKSTVKCTKALAATPFFHCECVNLTISQQSCSFFFLSGFSFTKIHDSQDSRGRGEVFCLTPLYHFYRLCRHLNISGTATAGSLPLHH